MSFKTGSFVKDTSLSTPVAQAIPHGLGEVPVAAMLWMCGITAFGTFTSNYRWAIGYIGGGVAYSNAASSQNGAATSVTSSRIAEKALTIVAPGESLQAEADFVSFDDTNINISWSTNDATAYIINFAVWGGDVTNAKAMIWSSPSASGELVVTGSGFNPDCLLVSGTGIASAPPLSQAYADYGFGVAVKGGGQWGIQSRAQDNTSTMNTGRAMVIFPLLGAADSGGTPFVSAGVRSWDDDGFTLIYDTAFTNIRGIGLALKGGSYASGLIQKTNDAATAVQKIGRIPTKLRGGLIGSAQQYTIAPYTAANAAIVLGAFDGTNELFASCRDDDNVADAVALSYGRDDKVIGLWNSGGGGTLTDAADAVVTEKELDLSWTTSGAANPLMGFVLFGDSPRSARARNLIGV